MHGCHHRTEQSVLPIGLVGKTCVALFSETGHAVLVGFIGGGVVMHPGVDGLINIYAFIPLAGAAGAAFAIISVRRLSQSESTATSLFYQATLVGLIAGFPLIWL